MGSGTGGQVRGEAARLHHGGRPRYGPDLVAVVGVQAGQLCLVGDAAGVMGREPATKVPFWLEPGPGAPTELGTSRPGLDPGGAVNAERGGALDRQRGRRARSRNRTGAAYSAPLPLARQLCAEGQGLRAFLNASTTPSGPGGAAAGTPDSPPGASISGSAVRLPAHRRGSPWRAALD